MIRACTAVFIESLQASTYESATDSDEITNLLMLVDRQLGRIDVVRLIL